jgi:hypothetical protein
MKKKFVNFKNIIIFAPDFVLYGKMSIFAII